MKSAAVLAFAAFVCALPLSATAQPSSASPSATPTAIALPSAAPSPSASSSPSASASPAATPKSTAKSSSARPSSTEVHRAIVICDREPFYVWPDRSSAPHVSGYSPAVRNESFDVIGDGTLAYGPVTLYETTIDAFAPYGGNDRHYWIRAACVNAG